jgi:hypothetical protein
MMFQPGQQVAPTRWTREQLSDRFVFRRHAYTAQRGGENNNLVVSELVGHQFGGEHKWGFTVTVQEDKDDDLIAGTSVYVARELMVDDTKPHNVPYFQLPDIGCFENWGRRRDNDTGQWVSYNVGNTIGVRIIWYNSKIKQWRERYVQYFDPRSSIAHSPTWVSSDEGSYTPYAAALGIYAYLRRFRWNGAPGWFVDMGVADVVVASVNHFRQEVSVQFQLYNGFKPAPRQDANAAGNIMRSLGLKNVDGTWQSNDANEATVANDAAAQREIAANGGRIINGLTTERLICDYHLVRKWVCQYTCVYLLNA